MEFGEATGDDFAELPISVKSVEVGTQSKLQSYVWAIPHISAGMAKPSKPLTTQVPLEGNARAFLA